MVYSVTVLVAVLFIIIESTFCAYFYTESQDGNKFVVKRGKVPENVQWLARAYMAVSELKRKGWGYLEIETSSNYPDMIQAYQAGFLEGTICGDLIYDYYEKMIINSTLIKENYYPTLMSFLDANTQWILNGVKSGQKFPMWLHLCLLYKQIEGVYHAVKQLKPNANITYSHMILLHAMGEFPEIIAGLGLRPPKYGVDFGTVIMKRVVGYNKTNTFILHSKLYEDEIRFQKKYTLPYLMVALTDNHKVRSKTLMFTSPPGIVTAEDGFYIGSANITVTRTAIDTAYRVQISSTSAIHLGFYRAYITTRIANGTRQWFNELCCFTGSTYNSEYIIVDHAVLEDEGTTNIREALMYAYDIPGSRRHILLGREFAGGQIMMGINVPKNIGAYHLTNQDKNVIYFGQSYSYGTPRMLKIRVYEDAITNLDDLLRVGQFNTTTDLLPILNGTVIAHFYPKTVVYTKLMNSMLHNMLNFAIVGYPDKGPIETYGNDGVTTFKAELEKERRAT